MITILPGSILMFIPKKAFLFSNGSKFLAVNRAARRLLQSNKFRNRVKKSGWKASKGLLWEM